MILGAMYVGAMAMAVFLILVQFQRRQGMPCTFPPLFRVELGVLGFSWDFWAKSVSELKLEVEQIQLLPVLLSRTRKYQYQYHRAWVG